MLVCWERSCQARDGTAGQILTLMVAEPAMPIPTCIPHRYASWALPESGGLGKAAPISHFPLCTGPSSWGRHTNCQGEGETRLSVTAFVLTFCPTPSLPTWGCIFLAPFSCSNCCLWVGSRGRMLVTTLKRQGLVIHSPCLYRSKAIYIKHCVSVSEVLFPLCFPCPVSPHFL